MRAIIRITTNIPDERIDDVLKSYGWFPKLSSQDVCNRNRDDILQTVHKDDIEVVKGSLLDYVLLHDPTKTWGIVNRPTDNALTFRLKNPVPDRLKTATEKLVKNLQSISEKDKSLSFEFEKIQVLEPGGDIHAFSGTVLPKGRFWLAVQRKKTEWLVGITALLSTLILLFLTMPPMREVIFLATSTWATWGANFFDRLTTSAIVTATVSLLNVFLYWFDLSRQSVVVWEA